MNLPFFQVDAFAPAPLTGNPAAVMPLERWLPDAQLQAIAAENNLSETAFTVPLEGGEADYHLRWFTPTTEVDMCGHATLAAGHILLTGAAVRFRTRSGILSVERNGELLRLSLPASRIEVAEAPDALAALGVEGQVHRGSGGNGAVIVPLADEAAVRAVRPDFTALRRIDSLVMVTACGEAADVASRVFAAYHGIDEDPVTGSAHAALVPLWAERLGRTRFSAAQVGPRSGELECELAGDRVLLSGRCWTVIEGSFQL
ncbi:PhzF family phenazine biosynthesis protein [Sphingomonas sp. BN140010]|uniref:PhzF family phenazine biosynthesis protein n=1 Tax=Sphingomonas arvum TaxID=2992113 RepID=A0ABT3JGF6_9SPHN|nr:PhzF family phenazine biosynthesis protein [Sphingomonas sp. BN140010]MCW3798171.1 PhzF family phenazine biosynthesis protein [Sphingomonas sp. BN140010]